MIKANAYGHGLIPIAKFVLKELGIKELGVATLFEAVTLRRFFPDLKFDIYVFSELLLDGPQAADYLDYRLIPVISNKDDLKQMFKTTFLHLPLCLKFDTGMNRLGIPYQEAPKIGEELKKRGRKNIFHLLSHFSSSYLPDSTQTIKQVARFSTIKSQLATSGIKIERTSLANSGAIEQGISLEESHIRPGTLLYGPRCLPMDKGQWKGRIISKLQTSILQVFPVKKGALLGYGATPCPKDGIIALIPLGYGDGFSTCFSGVKLKLAGYQAEIIGRISMDLTHVLFEKSAKKIKKGVSIDIWDDNPETFLSLCTQAQRIPYEICCLLTNRILRSYEH